MTESLWQRLAEIEALNRPLPADSDNLILSPIYLPAHSPYLKAWGTWCRAHPRSEWPSFLRDAVAQMQKRPKRTSVGQSLPSELGQSMPSTATTGGEGNASRSPP